MSKPTFEQAKVELLKVESAIESLTKGGVEIPAVLKEQYEKLKGVLQSNVSAQVAEKLNGTILVALNTNEKHKPLLDALVTLVGTKARLNLAVVKTVIAEGQPNAGQEVISLVFEAGGSVSSGSTGGGGGTRGESAFNHYKVTLLEDVPDLGSKGLVKEFESAAQAVKYILNADPADTTGKKGRNPMNLGADFGKGNSMPRVLESLQKNEVFKKHFNVEGSKVEKAKETAPATPETPATDAAPAAETTVTTPQA